MLILGRDFKKRHAKRLLGIIAFIVLFSGCVDFLAKDKITLTGTLYSKSYSTGKHDVTFRGHYVMEYKGMKHTESVSMYESDWDKLVENKSTRQFNVSESVFQVSIRQFWGWMSIILSGSLLATAFIMITGHWLLTDENGNF